MSDVKGKIRICQSNISDFNIEEVNNSPFYNRYDEFRIVFQKYIHDYDPNVIFAQPQKNYEKIDWFIPTPTEDPKTLESLNASDTEEEYKKYSRIKNSIIEELNKLSSEIKDEQELVYFRCATKFLNSEYIDKVTYCYDNKISFIIWGMRLRRGREIETVITDDVRDHRVHKISYQLQGNGALIGKTEIPRKHGYILQGSDIPEVKAAPHHSFVEWQPEAPHGKPVNSDLTFTAVCKRNPTCEIRFIATDGGSLQGNSQVTKKLGELLVETDIPIPIPNNGYFFSQWRPSLMLDKEIDDDMLYEALFEKEGGAPIPPQPSSNIHKIFFDAGDNGTIQGKDSFSLNHGESLSSDQIPVIIPNKGYTFTGWNNPPANPIFQDTTFTAQYAKKKEPWYKQLWKWFSGLSGCLLWLLRLLGILLLLFLLIWLFNSLKSCEDKSSCTGQTINDTICTEGGTIIRLPNDTIRSEDGTIILLPIDTIRIEDGTIIDDNGVVKPITGNDGTLPEKDIVAPVMGDDGKEPPIITPQPGIPKIIANRLFIFLENEDDNVDSFATDFKKVYPGEQYSIIGFDREVLSLIIQVPENERDEIRETINSKIPNHKFFVFDEQVYELGRPSPRSENPGWHLKAIHLEDGWKYTKGSKGVIVAIVDDGIQATHPMFKDRIVSAYNVFTQNNKLSLGNGHGTHTAGLAVGSSEFFSKGASGVAPECQIMPIQVFDNNRCPLSALVAGIMYAIHHDVDVVNISIGPSFEEYKNLPEAEQNKIAQSQFKNVEALWTRVNKLAAQKNCILVFAAGNDDILSSIPPENRDASSLIVTAVDEQLCQTDFTNYGPCSDISAPGKDIYSSFPINTFNSCDGTSMAAPIISGTIALMKSLKKDLTVKQAKAVLYKTGATVKGDIPPMVLVDEVLKATQQSDFDPEDPDKFKTFPIGNDIDDYSGIRQRIKELEDEIMRLKKLLPENK